MDKSDIPIVEVMTKKPVTVNVGQLVNFAAETMKKFHVSSVLVMKKDVLVGVLTTDDIVYKILAQKQDPNKVTVDDVMTTNLVTIAPSVSLQQAMQILSDNDIRQLPILHKGGLAGIITLKDILRYEPTLVDMMVENIRFEEQQRQETIKRYSETDIDDSLFD